MKIIELTEIDSTNEYLKRINEEESILVFTKKQKNGHGQYERKWYSNSKDSITFSYKYNNQELKPIDEDHLKRITERFSLLLNNYFNINSYIKLPNDIYLNQKKLCGILIETTYLETKLTKIIIGIGLNINNLKFPKYLEDIATSIYLETNKKYNIKDFKKYLIDNFENKIIKE